MTEAARRQMREDFARIERVAWSLVGALIVLALFLIVKPAKADVITEFGGGTKLLDSTSLVLQPSCHTVMIVETRPNDPGRNGGISSCGGDDPMFVGWPIAWEREYKGGRFRLRAGWFHFSHWFDGGRDRETQLNCACVTFTVNWSKRH